MHPVLFEIPFFGGLTIYTYGVLVALGFLAGMLWVGYEAKRVGEDPARATDLVFYVILAAIIGSRIVYVLVSDRQHFFQDPLSFFRIWEGGLVFYGGLIGATAVSIWYTRYHRRSFWVYADIFSPAIALGHAFGRIGCLMAGCCHGRPAPMETWWTLNFPVHAQGFAPPGIPLYPTQPMESLTALTIFLVLFLLRRFQRFRGEMFVYYLALYGCARIVLEQYRGDAVRGHLLGGLLSTSQLISIGLLVAAAGIWCWQRRRGRIRA
jgi:phosphatidylglycerol---prolipoprotein diacylglyceryl transferase